MREDRPAFGILKELVLGKIAVGVHRHAAIAQRGEREQRVDAREVAEVERAAGPLEVRVQRHRLVGTDLFLRIETADEPVESIVERGALKPKFLGEGADAVTRRQNARARGRGTVADRIGVVAGEAADRGLARLEMAIGGDRGQLGRADIPDQFSRCPPLLRSVKIGAAVDRQILQRGEAGLGDAIIGEAMKCGKGRQFGLAQDHRLAALLVGARIVYKQADADIAARLDIELAAQHVPVAIVAFRPGGRSEITIRLAPGARDADAGDIGHDGQADPSLDVHEIIIAVAGVGEPLDLGQAGALGRHVERTGRGVAAEERPLGTAQNL